MRETDTLSKSPLWRFQHKSRHMRTNGMRLRRRIGIPIKREKACECESHRMRHPGPPLSWTYFEILEWGLSFPSTVLILITEQQTFRGKKNSSFWFFLFSLWYHLVRFPFVWGKTRLNDSRESSAPISLSEREGNRTFVLVNCSICDPFCLTMGSRHATSLWIKSEFLGAVWLKFIGIMNGNDSHRWCHLSHHHCFSPLVKW